jgi:predicted RNase H-like nuclease (RuvC/YqgF family)
LFRYQAGFVPVPEVDRSSAATTAMWAGYKNLEAEISIHKARIQARDAKINNLETEVDRLRRENEAMKNEIRRGIMPVISHTDSDTKDAGVAREDTRQEVGVQGKLKEEEEEDDVLKRLFSNDRLVQRIMRLL